MLHMHICIPGRVRLSNSVHEHYSFHCWITNNKRLCLFGLLLQCGVALRTSRNKYKRKDLACVLGLVSDDAN